MNFEMRDI